MSFTPSDSNLGIVQVNQNFSFVFNYTTETTPAIIQITVLGNTSYFDSILNQLVSSTFVLPNTVNISSNTISGYFDSSVFDRAFIEYTVKNIPTQTRKIDRDVWNELDRRSDVQSIFNFRPDTRQSIVIQFLVVATYEDEFLTQQQDQKTYTLTVQHPSYSIGAEELRKRLGK
jgi:hypothetical protein